MPLKPGDRFGRYELTELLGKGGMGEVFSAQDTLLHRRVALKVLHPPREETGTSKNKTDGAARILREARAAAGINHPNAIAIYDVGEVDGVPFLAMELVSGRTLRAYIKDESVTMPRRIRWLTDIARALDAAHQLGLVHRDIKPENVMVRDDGVVKVLDFGIARRVSTTADPSAPTEGASAGTLTADGVVVGTPFYMAPEQMRGEMVDGRTDQFAWGVVAYELLTGDLPWNRTTSGLQMVAQILTREVAPPRGANPLIPASVDAVVRVALAKSPANRFQRMHEIADELEAYAAPAGVMTGRSGARTSTPPVREEISLAPTQEVPPSAVEPRSGPSTRTQLASAPVVSPQTSTRWRSGVAAVLALMVAGAVGYRFTATRNAVAIPPDAAASGGAESQMSANPQATGAYRAGLQALRDASPDSAAKQLDRAIELDPTFAAAHLRRALLASDFITPEMRKDLLAARHARGSLGTRDRVLLDAVEPWMSEPPDLRESERRLEAAVKQYPESAELEYELGWTLHNTYDSAQAAAAFDSAVAKDPSYAMALCMKGREQVNLDDVAGATSTYERCLKVSPAGTACLGDLATLEGNEGKCAEMASTSRRLIAVDPSVADSYRRLAEALFSLGEPLGAVRAALNQEWDRLPASWRPVWQPHEEAYLAILTGRFAEAERLTRDFERASASLAGDSDHIAAAYDRILLDLEQGRTGDALKVATDYLGRRSAWQANDLAPESTILVYASELAAGGLTRAAFEKLRGEWLARNQKRVERIGAVGDAYAGTSWGLAFALPATTKEDALAALAALPSVHPLIDALTSTPYIDEPIGRTYLLAGHLDDAMKELTRASTSCAVLDFWAPVFSTQAASELGEAFEARGDTAAACSSYRRVLARWGAATSSSRTATKAGDRARALHCPP